MIYQQYDSDGDTVYEGEGTTEKKEIIVFDSQGESITSSDYEDFLEININDKEVSCKHLYIVI